MNRKVLLFVLLLVSLLVGVWADLARGRWPDYFSPLSAGIGLLMAYLCADIFLPLIMKSCRRVFFGLMWSAAYVVCAHVLPIVLAGLVQIPRVGWEFLPDVFAGAWYTLRQAWLPMIVGSVTVHVASRMGSDRRQDDTA